MSDAEGEFASLYVEPERPEQRIDWPALQFNDVFKIFRSGPVETVACAAWRCGSAPRAGRRPRLIGMR